MSLAERYEKYLVPIIMDRWAEEVVRIVEPGDMVLDLGCGTGAVTRYAAARLGAHDRIAALDISSDMLNIACVACENIRSSLDLVRGDACSMPFKVASFDKVLSQFSLMFVADKTDTLREMRRVLKQDGRLRIAVFISGPYDQALRSSLSKHVKIDETSFSIWNCSDLKMLSWHIGEAGFDIINLEKKSTPSCYASVRQSLELMKDWNDQIANLSGAEYEQIICDLEAELHDYITPECFACPEPVAIVTAKVG